VAEDGKQTLATLARASSPLALILLDMNKSVLNGLDFLTRYTQLLPTSPRPVVAPLLSSDHSLDQARAQHL
jgi:CheY-like chemotaxis protein